MTINHSNNAPLIAYFGHHKCASTWINDTNLAISLKMGITFRNVNNPHMFGHNLPVFIENNRIDFLGYSNAEYEHVKRLENFKGFHVIRDPRDIAVSSYFSHLHTHSTDHWPELVGHRKRLQKLDFEEGLIADVEFTRNVYEDLFNWNYEQPNVMELKIEEMTRNPYEILTATYRFLGLVDVSNSTAAAIVARILSYINRFLRRVGWRQPIYRKIPLGEVLTIQYMHRFSKKARTRRPGQEDRQSHYRKGVAGDWKNHFSEAHRAYFKVHFSGLLFKLGYQGDNEW